MAIGLLAILKLVPWGDVISNAPKVADGAMKLWRTVAGKQPVELPTSSAQPARSAEEQSLAVLQGQLAAAETKISDLHNQMLESSELIKALADQNTQLIKRFEVVRIRVLLLAGGVAVIGVVAAIYLAISLTR